jgi:hypothetical protein
MPRFRIKVISEAEYIVDAEAPTSTQALADVVRAVRANKLEPLVVGIAKSESIELPPRASQLTEGTGAAE